MKETMMNKYYVRVMDNKMMLMADDELDACVRCSRKHGITTGNLTWAVSEKGFEKHDDDVLIPDDIIMQELLRDYM
jgi:hypothetical protein